jgi:hypothetical protein
LKLLKTLSKTKKLLDEFSGLETVNENEFGKQGRVSKCIG